MFCHINPIKFLLNHHYNPPWMTEATIPSPLHGSACPSPWTASCFASGGDMSTWRFLVIWCVWNSSPLECMSMCIMYIIYYYVIYTYEYYEYICIYNCLYIYMITYVFIAVYIYIYIYVYISHILGFQGFRQQWVFDAAKKPVESCQEPLGNWHPTCGLVSGFHTATDIKNFWIAKSC
jgi:hypothetical protein